MICKTKLGYFEGLELEPFKVLTRLSNLSVDFVEVRPPEEYAKNPWEYALAMVEKGEADLSLGHFVAMKNRVRDYRLSYPLYQDTVLWLVTKGNSHSRTAFNIIFFELCVIYFATACGMRVISWSSDMGLKKNKMSTLFMVKILEKYISYMFNNK